MFRRAFSKLLQHSKQSSSQPRFDAIAFEPLEPRMMLAVFVVDSVADDISGIANGQLTLREAIIAAETNAPFGDAGAGGANDVIQFAPALINQTIPLINGPFLLSDDLTINGGALNITIDAFGTTRIFSINTTETISINNLRLTNGRALSEGGAIHATGSGNLNLNNVIANNNTADGTGGGAIFSQIANLSIDDSTFNGNRANGPAGIGGAVLVAAGDVIVTDSNFISNVANRSGGAIEVSGGKLETIDTDFVTNVAGPTGSANPGNGGAIHVSSIAASEVILRGGSVEANTAASQGGGLWNQFGSSMIVRDGVNIFNNVAKGAASNEGGGGIYNNGGTLRVINSTISSNSANGLAGSGGGVFTAGGTVNIRDSRISTNKANRAGGGIEVLDGYLKLDATIIGGDDLSQRNVAGPSGFATPGDGGGIHVSGTIGTTVVIDGGTIANNLAANQGAGIWNQAGAVLIVRNATRISDNRSTNSGAGIFNNGGTVLLNNTVIINNQANGNTSTGGGIASHSGPVNINGGQITSNSAFASGGGINIQDGNLEVSGTTISGNSAGIFGFGNPGSGGGVHVSGLANVEISNSTISSNVAVRNGGGLWNQSGSTMILRNSQVDGNAAQGQSLNDGGGGIFNNGGTLRLINSHLNANMATGQFSAGGGVYSTGGVTNIRMGSTITRNQAVRSGGGIEFGNGYLRVEDSTFGGLDPSSGNIAGQPSIPGDGGGVHISGTESSNFVLFVGVTVQNNVASRSGGGLWNQAGTTMTIRASSVISNNVANGGGANDGGGGIFNNGGTVRVSASTVVSNRTPNGLGSGGGIFSVGGVINVRDNSQIRANIANNNGGGIGILNGYANITNSTIGGNPGVDTNRAKNGGGFHIAGTNGTTAVFDNTRISANDVQFSGGGIWNQSNATILLRNGTTVRENIARGINVNDGGGGIYNRTNGNVIIVGSTVINNISDGTNGNGGGVFNANGGVVSMTGATVSGNFTRGNGGGMFNAGTLNGNPLTTISANLALKFGGGIFVGATGVMNLNSTVVVGNNPDNIAS